MMQISPGGKTVHFEADSKPLFDSEKNGTQPVFVAILEHSQRKRITSKIEHIFIRYFHEDFFIRDITGIYDVGRIEAYYVVSFVWLPLSPHDHRDSMHELGACVHLGDEPFMRDVMKIKMSYAPPQALEYPAESSDSPMNGQAKEAPHRSYLDTLTEQSLRPPLLADIGISYDFNDETREIQITRFFNTPLPPAICYPENDETREISTTTGIARPANAPVLSTVHHLENGKTRDTHEWIHFKKDEQGATALLEALGAIPKVYHFTNVKPFTAISIAVIDLTIEQVELELRNIFRRCPFKFIGAPTTRLITELRIRGICGVAVCNAQDSFDECRGRTIAKGRLAKHLRDVKRFLLRQLSTDGDMVGDERK